MIPLSHKTALIIKKISKKNKTFDMTNLQECSHSGRASHTQSRTHQKPSILTLHTLNLECALRGDMEVPIRVAWEHKHLAAFLSPEHRWWWVARCHALKTRQPVQTNLLILRLCCEYRWSCKHMQQSRYAAIQKYLDPIFAMP